MSQCVHSCFSSYLSQSPQLKCFLQIPETQYKIIKAADAVFDAIAEISKASHASETSLAAIAFGRSTLKALRNVLGGIHIVTSILPSLILSIKLHFDLIKSFFTHADVTMHANKGETVAYIEKAQGVKEKSVCLSALTTKSVKSAASLSAFTLSHFVGTEKQHGTLMLIKHTSGAAAHAFEMSFYSLAFDRAISQGTCTVECYAHYIKKMHALALGIIEKGLQVLYDIAKMLQGLPPAWFRLPLTFSISLIGLYGIWVKTQ
jgi:hypothetical protein